MGSTEPPATTQPSPADETEVHRQRVSFCFEYPVFFTRNALDPRNQTLVAALSSREKARRHRIVVVIDGGLWDAWPDLDARIRSYCGSHDRSLELVGDPIRVPGGEQAKQSPALLDAMHSRLNQLGIDRQSFVVIFGGGAVLDAVGYAAAGVHRGVRVVRVPTTVLAQSDAGIGVKNGVNAFGSKNFLGSFAPPFAVVNDTEFLTTLSARDMRAGIAEAVKVALIRDAAFFDWLGEHAGDLAGFAPDAMHRLIRHAAKIHLRHIASSGDPFELGSARPLDFGHWAAHKLESLSRHRLRHGEAVAIGMALDCRYSVEAGLLGEADLAAILHLLRTLGFRLWDEALEALDEGGRPVVLGGLADFREHLGGELTVTLLTGIGSAVEVHRLDEDKLRGALQWLRDGDGERCS